jgi:hypothetical protein
MHDQIALCHDDTLGTDEVEWVSAKTADIARIFVGFDHRQVVSYAVLQASILAHAKAPATVSPLVLQTLPIARSGLTPFTFSRFLVPWLCGFRGWALFLDSDMLALADVTALFKEYADPKCAVRVVKNPLRFEWASLMLWNCGHPANGVLTPSYVDDPGINHFKFPWLPEAAVGDLPREWNHLVGYDAPRPDAKIVHYTMGVPAYEETKDCEYAAEWRSALAFMTSTAPWIELMGKSRHVAQTPGGRVLPLYHPDLKGVQANGQL